MRLGTGIGGKSFVIVTGEVAAVRAAIEAGISTPPAEGLVISSVVIPSPHPELLDSLMDKLLGRSPFTGISPVDPFCGVWGAEF